jgi:hypothetical protein
MLFEVLKSPHHRPTATQIATQIGTSKKGNDEGAETGTRDLRYDTTPNLAMSE